MTQTRNGAITVTIRAFAIYRERLGRAALELDLPAGATVASALAALAEANPSVSPFVEHTLVAVNQEYAESGQPLAHGDEVALIPPVSGGSVWLGSPRPTWAWGQSGPERQGGVGRFTAE